MSFQDEYLTLMRQASQAQSQQPKQTQEGEDGRSDFLSRYKAAMASGATPALTRNTSRPGGTLAGSALGGPIRSGKTKEEEGFDWSKIAGPLTMNSQSKDSEKWYQGWFQKGAFADGYDPGDITKTILGTVTDLGQELGEGVLNMGENVVDAGAYLLGLGAETSKGMWGGRLDGFYGNVSDSMRDFVKKDLYDSEEVVKANKGWMPMLLHAMGEDEEEASVLGTKSEQLANSAGQLIGQAGLQAVGVPWFVTSGVTSFGGEVDHAFKEDASYGEAALSATITAGAEILTEKISGGIKFGGKTLDDRTTKAISRSISNKILRTLAKAGVDMAGEGAEEVLSSAASAVGQKLSYLSEEEWNELLSREELMDAFIAGAIMGGGSNVSGVIKSQAQGVDSVTGLTKNEQAVVDKLYHDAVDGKQLSSKEKGKIYDAIVLSVRTSQHAMAGAQQPSDSISPARQPQQGSQSRQDAINDILDTVVAGSTNAPADPVGAALEGFAATGVVTNKQAADILGSVKAVTRLVEEAGVKLPDTASGRRAAVKQAIADLAQKQSQHVDTSAQTDYDKENTQGGTYYASGSRSYWWPRPRTYPFPYP